jgi:VanZ family protein
MTARESPPAPLARSAGRSFVVYWLPAAGYTVLIFALSSIHGGGPPWLFPHVDKLEHLLEYSLLGLLLGRAIRFTLGGGRRRLAAVATVGLGAAVGALDEIYQAHVPGRDSSAADWLADVAALGLAVLWTQVVRTRALTPRGRGGTRPPSDTSETLAR